MGAKRDGSQAERPLRITSRSEVVPEEDRGSSCICAYFVPAGVRYPALRLSDKQRWYRDALALLRKGGRLFCDRKGAWRRLLTRLMSMHPVGPVLLVLGVLLMLLAGRLKEERQLPARLLALLLAVAGAVCCFTL